ncbi:VUT family protein [Desulfovibrio sp. OttesenSCG-928-A18]|nr:VUT family protein [Desulfovibrio sp. OttesenSCG-928-A18]
MKYALLYIFTVVLVNCAFDLVPLLTLPGGEQWSPVALAVGFVFVIRDYAQREIGHYVLPAMLLGGGISWLMATPEIALASMYAFLIGELLDWAVYTFTGRPFSQRVLLSSALSTPVDSAVFLAMIGLFSFSAVLVMTLSKMAGALIVFFLARRRELLTQHAGTL